MALVALAVFTPLSEPQKGPIKIGYIMPKTGNFAQMGIARFGISLVPQGRQIFPSLDVSETLAIGARPRPDGWTVEKVYELFPPLRGRARHPAGRLSGGEHIMSRGRIVHSTSPSELARDAETRAKYLGV